ncbi:hypothetical protein V6N11_009271 [Hibiscus sabdariffa]|uniref:Uncharacterized protein n=1 Tax=Hibiscus sabdariffa TaxID=183260 RepID=A0ABR2PQ54_9ROSI
MRQFIWGSSSTSPKISLVDWVSVCQPVKCGGLGIRRVYDFNVAFVFKIGFSLVSDTDALWIRLLRQKYKVFETYPLSLHRPISTPLWRAISTAWEDIRASIAWSLGTGTSINPLDDNWVPSLGPLRPYLLHDLTTLQVRKISDLIDDQGQWDVMKLLGMFNPTVIPHILRIRPPDESDMPDKPIWSLNAKNVFDIKSAYASLNSGAWEPESGCWKAIWSLQVPQRLRIFLWLSHKAKLMTNVERCRRSLSQQALCPCCHEFPETLLHVFRDCKYVIGVWSRLLPPRHLATFYSDDFCSWLLSNVATTVMHPTLEIPWHLLFASTLWQIWKNRNAWVFNGTMSNVANTVICSLTWARYYSECTFKAPSSHSPIRKSTHWQRPERGWVSLCTDGAVSATSGIGSVSGVFRKDDGSWFYGFNKSIGIMQPLQAELWGLFIGIQIAWDIGLKKLLIQSDSKEAIKLLNTKDAASNNCALV